MKKSRTYILYMTWGGTLNNHAGMAYLVRTIKKAYPDRIKLIQMPANIGNWHILLQRVIFYFLVYYLKFKLKSGDKVLFMEYLGVGAGNHQGISRKLRMMHVQENFIGLVHLTDKYLLEYHSIKEIIIGIEALNKVIVFGSSLTKFFDSLGFVSKVTQTVHYVDNNYYYPTIRKVNEKLKVIHMGTNMRKFGDLRFIVEACPEIDFYICQGCADIGKLFEDCRNATLYNFLSEDELLKLMQVSDISISVLEDTVGSNVITTSMACGLVNVVSDVGSIRDYCNDENSILCKTNDEFIFSLKKLNSNRLLLEELGNNALKDSADFSIEKSIDFFYKNVIL